MLEYDVVQARTEIYSSTNSCSVLVHCLFFSGSPNNLPQCDHMSNTSGASFNSNYGLFLDSVIHRTNARILLSNIKFVGRF